MSTAAHLLLIMPGTIKRNYLNGKGSKLIYYPIVSAFSLLLLISAFFDIMLQALVCVEYIVALFLSPLCAFVYPLTQREDCINTVFHALETVFPKFEIQKLDTIAELDVEPCRKNGSCGKVISLGGYREVDWACDNCIALIKKLKELKAAPSVLDKVNVRGYVVSEYCPLLWQSSRIIEKDGFKNLRTRKFLIMRTYDTSLFKWKRVYVRARAPDRKNDLLYELHRHRTEVLTCTVKKQEDFIALKSFSVAAKDWNKLYRNGYNNQNRQFVKLVGSGLLLGIQAAVGLLQIEKNNSTTLKALAILVSTQLAWFQVVSEVLLADVPLENITEANFERVSTARARAIRYVDTGDQQSVFSGAALSWYTNNTLTGSSEAKPVLPIELLLNANRLVTNEHVYNFSCTGITIYRHNIVPDQEAAGKEAQVALAKEYWTCTGSEGFTEPSFLVR